jgi:hypothetical protein
VTNYLTIMSDFEKKRPTQIVVSTRPRASSGDSVATRASLKPPSLRSPRTARFAEATAVHSPIEPRSNHFMAQPQVSDVGFGYVQNKHESVEMPDTDNNDYPAMKTPLKSALKTPGAPPRDFGQAMLSPTFKEEQQLEKDQAHTDKEQARDLVNYLPSTIYVVIELTSCAENQSSRTDRQVLSQRHQLFVRTYYHLHAVCHIHHLQRNKNATASQQSTPLGGKPEDLASSLAHQHCVYHASSMHLGLLLILEGRPPTRRKDLRLLLCLRGRILHLQYCHVGCCRWCSSRLQKQLRQQGHVGMVLRR